MTALNDNEYTLLQDMRALRDTLKPQTRFGLILTLLISFFFLVIGVVSLVKLGARLFDIDIPKSGFPVLAYSIGFYDQYIKAPVEALVALFPPLSGFKWLHYPLAIYLALAGSMYLA